jgi:hypothetical protein
MVTSPRQNTESEISSAAAPAAEEGLTFRGAAAALGVGTLFIVLTAIAIRHSEMVTGRYISHGVPPLSAFAAVLFLSLFRPVLQRHAPRFAPSRSQILLIYVMLATSTILSGSYHVRAFLPHLVALQYHERPDGAFAGTKYSAYLPSWLAPHDSKVVQDYYNGSPDGAVPWGAWIGPLVWWSLFLSAVFLGGYCLMRLVEKKWTQDEKLSFPLLFLPLAMSSEDWSSYGSRNTRIALLLLGFGAAALFNGLNIVHILQPIVPSPGFYISLQEYFPDRLWKPFGSIYLFFMLEAIGIGYFVPLEVTFSTWFFYLCNRVFAVAGTAAGYDQPGFPFTQEQSFGGYLAVGFLLVWGLRATFRNSLRRSFRVGVSNAEARAERALWLGLFSCVLFTLGFCYAAGFSLLLSVPFLFILGVFVLVYARIRAETGVPFGFIYPYGLPKEGLLNAISFETAQSWGGTRSITLFSSLAWLSRHHLPEEHAAYQLDAMKLGQEARIHRRTIFIGLIVAFLIGLAAAYWVHLSAYYSLGANMAGGGTGEGEFRATVAQQEYQQMIYRVSTPPNRNVPALFAVGGGFLFTTALYWLRLHWLGSPFHPLGFILATAYGDASAMWFPMFVAWILKAAILRIGGLKLYRTGIPFFLGLTMGHFFMAGIFWPVLSLFVSPEASKAYHLYFGG